MLKKNLLYCLKCRKNNENKNPRVVNTKNRRIMLLSNCAFCNKKNPRIINKQEVIGLVSVISKTPLLDKQIV